MGLLDGVLGSVLGGQQQGQGGGLTDPKTMLMMGAMAMLAKSAMSSGQAEAGQGAGGGLAGMLGGLLGGGQQQGGGLAGALGGLLGGGQAQGGMGALGALGGLVGAAGGVEGIAKLFQSSGMGDQVSSWIGTGENMPISASQIMQVLGGSGHLEQLAGAAGVSQEEAATHLSDILPQLINQVTPNGQAPAGGLDLASMLQQVLGKQA